MHQQALPYTQGSHCVHSLPEAWYTASNSMQQQDTRQRISNAWQTGGVAALLQQLHVAHAYEHT